MKRNEGLVVRRGQSFTIDLHLSREFDEKYDYILPYFEFEKSPKTINSNAWKIDTKYYIGTRIFRLEVRN